MRRFLVILAALLALLLGTIHAQGRELGSIQGRVVNGSAGGGSLAGLEVTLEGIGPDGTELPPRKALIESDGSFAFAGLPLGEGYTYRVRLSYTDVVYTSPEVRLRPDAPTTSLELTVYEPTTSDSALKGTIDHLVLDFDPATHTLWVLEYLVIENTGDTTFVGSAAPDQQGLRATLRFLLPPGVEQVELLRGVTPEQTIPWEGGFADTSPLPPGSREVVFSYTLPYESERYTLQKTLAYPTDKVAVLVPDVGVNVHSDALPNVSTTDVEGQSYLLLSGEGLTSDTVVEIALKGLPMSVASGGSSPNRSLVIGVGIAMAFALGGAVFYARRRLAAQPVPAAPSGEREKASLLAALADLDQRYEAGQISQEEYQREREATKERLRNLW